MYYTFKVCYTAISLYQPAGQISPYCRCHLYCLLHLTCMGSDYVTAGFWCKWTPIHYFTWRL